MNKEQPQTTNVEKMEEQIAKIDNSSIEQEGIAVKRLKALREMAALSSEAER